MKAYWVFYLRPKNFISIIINQILKQKWSGTEKSLDIKVELPPPPPTSNPGQDVAISQVKSFLAASGRLVSLIAHQ